MGGSPLSRANQVHLAKMLRTVDLSQEQRRLVAEALCEALEQFVPSFDRETFMAYAQSPDLDA